LLNGFGSFDDLSGLRFGFEYVAFERFQKEFQLVFLEGSRDNGHHGALCANHVHVSGLFIDSNALDLRKSCALLGVVIQVK
jgi:hypothetical protein